MSDVAAEPVITSVNVDLTNCDREQIQYPGAIQPHGAMIVLSEPELLVLQASENSADLLGSPAESLLGGGLRRLLTDAEVATFQERLRQDEFNGAPLHVLGKQLGDRVFDVLAHRSDGALILEFEERASGTEWAVPNLYPEFQESVSRLGAASGLQSFLDLAAQRVRFFTGFDRVMIYKFLEDGSGWVRSEALKAGLEPYLGLHYPASDIPAPARRLFSLTWVRHQPDIGYRPVRMVPENNPQTNRPVDMSYAFLRSASVMYIDYLKNMGTQSSLVMTLMKEGRLWGLMACHHHSGPKHVPYEARLACEFTAHVVSLMMSAKEDAEQQAYRAKLQSTQALLVANLLLSDDFGSVFTGGSPTLLDFVNCSGAACVLVGGIRRIGATPTEDQIGSIVRWLQTTMDTDVFATDCLSSQFSEAVSFAPCCSGLLALRFSKSNHDFLLWFRPETVQTVNWAGDPSKPVNISADGQRLTPRTSFALWKETVRLKSQPWTELEVASATYLRAASLEVVLTRAEKLGELYHDLASTHAQLDSFAYVAAHDLKEPLRGIHAFSQILQERYSGNLDADSEKKLAGLIRLSKRMDQLVDALLTYSRVGRKLVRSKVDLNVIVSEALDSLSEHIQSEGVAVRIPRYLPTVSGDPEQIREVFTNLISNAVKYNDKQGKDVEIGFDERTKDGPVVLFVKDNGIGIERQYQEQIFKIFQRLHERNAFGGGTGAGLTIVKKIIERHGGRIWVESTPDEGSVFYFTLSAGSGTGSTG